MPSSNLSPNLSAVNPEDIQQLLRDYADCKKQLAGERRQTVKLRADIQHLEKVAESGERWMLRALEAMRESQPLKEVKLGINNSTQHPPKRPKASTESYQVVDALVDAFQVNLDPILNHIQHVSTLVERSWASQILKTFEDLDRGIGKSIAGLNWTTQSKREAIR